MDATSISAIVESLRRYLRTELTPFNVDVDDLVDRFHSVHLQLAIEYAARLNFVDYVQHAWPVSKAIAMDVWDYWKATEEVKLDKYYMGVSNVAMFSYFKSASIDPFMFPEVQQCILLPKVKAWKEHNAAMLIQHAWRRSISNPAYSLCRLRLLAEFDSISDS